MDENQVAKTEVGAIIVAAGSSRRMGGTDKILAPLGGKPVLAWSLEVFQQHPKVGRIVLVNNQQNMGPVRCLVMDHNYTRVKGVCLGGRRRQDSVAAGLQELGECEWVIIHDGARPLITGDLIDRGLEAARETGAAVAAVPVSDTIKLAGDNQMVIFALPRQNLWAVQTPQVFRYDILKEAYRASRVEATDDATLVELAGYRVKIFAGETKNIKITNPHDLELAEALIKENGA